MSAPTASPAGFDSPISKPVQVLTYPSSIDRFHIILVQISIFTNKNQPFYRIILLDRFSQSTTLTVHEKCVVSFPRRRDGALDWPNTKVTDQ